MNPRYSNYYAALDGVKKLQALKVLSVTRQIEKESAPPAYNNLSLLEDAERLLGWQTKDCMEIAQSLFEKGLITYPRSDASFVIEDAAKRAKDVVRKEYGSNALKSGGRLQDFYHYKENRFTLKASPVLGAHEAIRPTDPALIPDEAGLLGNEAALYRMIWQRFIAFYMKDARYEVVEVEFEPAL